MGSGREEAPLLGLGVDRVGVNRDCGEELLEEA